MAGNIIFEDGNQLKLAVPAGVVSGDPLTFGNQPCVALTSRDSDGNATVKFDGVALLELANAVAEDAVYIDPSALTLTLTDTASTVFFGTCINDADADDMVRVRIGGIEPGSGS